MHEEARDTVSIDMLSTSTTPVGGRRNRRRNDRREEKRYVYAGVQRLAHGTISPFSCSKRSCVFVPCPSGTQGEHPDRGRGQEVYIACYPHAHRREDFVYWLMKRQRECEEDAEPGTNIVFLQSIDVYYEDERWVLLYNWYEQGDRNGVPVNRAILDTFRMRVQGSVACFPRSYA